MNSYSVTIIGAGLTGISAARKLQEQGVTDFIVVDKGKSVGGRLATRRVGDGKADHGAQFFTARTEELKTEVDHWLSKGWIKHWFGEKYPRYTSVNGMNQFAKELAEGLPVSLQTKVNKINEDAKGMILVDSIGNVWRSERVLITIPVPQVIELLKNSEVSISHGAVKLLKSITFTSTYVGIFEFENSTKLPDNGHIHEELPDGVERIVDHKKKGISEDTIVCVYMTGDWSRRHFGEDYVMSLIKEKAGKYLDWADLKSEQLKKWRYAQANQTVNEPYVDLNDNGRFIVAGDPFLREDDTAKRTRFESAYLSGNDAGDYLIKL